MKKILIYLQSLLLITTPVLTTISCNKTNGNSTNDKLSLSEQEQKFIKNTSLYTKLLLLSRHENLNFNSTEILNAVFTPKTSWYAIPRSYTVDNKKTYNLTDYTEELTSSYSNLGKFNATKFDPFTASILTGMYDNSFYQDYVNQNEIKENDIFNFFGEKEMSDNKVILDENLKLSNDPNRKQLAWANFTGPLSKYIADKQLINYQDLNYKGENAKEFYGRFLDATFKRSENDKLLKTENGMQVNIGNDEIKEEFGKYQTKLFDSQVKSNFSSKVLEFIPFIQNFNATASGSIYGLKLLNNLFPFTDTKADMDTTYVLFLLLQQSILWMQLFLSNHFKGDAIAKKIIDKAKEIQKIFNKFNSLYNINFLGRISDNKNSYDFKVQMLMNKTDKDKKIIDLFGAIKEFKNLTSNWAKNWDDETKESYLKDVKKKMSFFKELAEKLEKKDIINFMEEAMKSLETPDDVIDLYDALGDMMCVIADNQQKFLDMEQIQDIKGKNFDALLPKQQNLIASTLGFKDNKFEEGSVLQGLHKILHNKTFEKFILNHDSPLYKYNSENAKEIHENLLQYALDDKYWKINPKSLIMNGGAISGKESINKKISYSLEYNGKGDKTVTKFLEKPVDIPENFNPFEPWYTPTAISKEWNIEDYISYTGLGNDEKYGEVNFKYNVEWSNVSKEHDFTYWVITKIDCFRKENGDWKQFYPVM